FVHSVAAGADGNVWFAIQKVHGVMLGRITPAGQIREYPVPLPANVGAQEDAYASYPTMLAATARGGLAMLVNYSISGVGVATTSVLDANQQYVMTLYQEALGRRGTPAERNTWLPMLVTQGLRPVAEGILHSSEAWTRLVKSGYVSF